MRPLSKTERVKARGIAFLIWTLCALLVAFIVRDSRERAAASRSLAALSDALQAYHEKRGSMPRLNNASGRDLVKFLQLSGQLPELPLNPATARPYDPDAESETDGITYNSEGNFSGYDLFYVRPRDNRELDRLTHPYRENEP